ncbi:MAG: hypothetical protein QXI19_15155, partial [Candidatus Caldarchaeum sp.]
SVRLHTSLFSRSEGSNRHHLFKGFRLVLDDSSCDVFSGRSEENIGNNPAFAACWTRLEQHP